MPLMPVDKCVADTSLLAEILLQKQEYHVPFYPSDTAIPPSWNEGLTESTLDGWFKKTVELLLSFCKKNSNGKAPVTMYRRMKLQFRSLIEKTQNRQGISLDGKISHGETGHLPLRRDHGPERSSQPWQLTTSGISSM